MTTPTTMGRGQRRWSLFRVATQAGNVLRKTHVSIVLMTFSDFTVYISTLDFYVG